MARIFAMQPDVRFEDKLTYCKLNVISKKCPFDSTHNMLEKWERPLQVTGPVRPYTDFEWTVYGDLIVTSHVRRTLTEAGFTGFRSLQVDFFSTSESPFGRDSFEIEVTGWGGRARKESGIETLEECPGCRRRVFLGYENPAMLFDPVEWDGSDFFVIWPMPRTIFVMEEVRKCIVESQFSGVRFIEISKFPAPCATFTPPSLESLFDSERAKQIKDSDPSWWYGSNGRA